MIKYLVYLFEAAVGTFFTVDVLLPNNFFGIEKNFVKPRRDVICSLKVFRFVSTHGRRPLVINSFLINLKITIETEKKIKSNSFT